MRLFASLALGALAVVTLAGCPKPAINPGDATFCKSYEDNYLAACRQTCESGISIGDAVAIKACRSKCNKELGADKTFDDRCGARAAQFRELE